MKILVIGTIDNRGGAAKVSWELRRRLKADGHSVTTLVRYKYSDESDIFAIPRKRWQDWLVKLFANDLRFARTGYIFNTKEYKEADIIHCHNLHSNFFNLKDLIRMSHEKPLVWTIHDLWAITGFASDSVTLRNPNKKRFLLYLWDATPFLLKTKELIYKRSRLHVVAVSNWLKKQIDSSVLHGHDTLTIHNGVDTSTFKPRDKTLARKSLGLPLNKKIVAFGKKGWIDSLEIAKTLKDRQDIALVSIGCPDAVGAQGNVTALPVLDKEKLAICLSAADVFLYPTQGDTFGLIAAEAMSCGTPVVAYDTDALPEIVTDKEIGYIARRNDREDARTGVEHILSLSEKDYSIMSHKASRRVENDFSLDKMYREYLALYKKTISDEAFEIERRMKD